MLLKCSSQKRAVAINMQTSSTNGDTLIDLKVLKAIRKSILKQR